MFVTTDAGAMCFSEKQQKKPLHQLLQWLLLWNDVLSF